MQSRTDETTIVPPPPLASPDPQLTISLALAELEVIRIQLGIAQQPDDAGTNLIRDLSPLGRRALG